MNINTIKNRLNVLQTSGQKKEKIDYDKYLWKPKKEGKYQIRIIPSEHDKENPFKEVFIHYGFAKYPIYALTNWSAEKWDEGVNLFPFFNNFDGVVVSGKEKVRKPFPEIYKLILNRYEINPKKAIFIDDNFIR